MDRIIQAVHFDGQNIADIFKLSCVTSIRKSYPNLVFATVYCGDGCKRVVRKGDWIVETRKKGFHTTFSATMERLSAEVLEQLLSPSKYDVTMIEKIGKLPRKMKKACRSDYPRNTKWRRKAESYIRKHTHFISDAEVVVTEEQQGILSVQLKKE